MKAESEHRSKHMVEIAGKPFLFYLVDIARRVGCKRIIIVVGYHAHYIEEFFAGQTDVEIVNQYTTVPDKYGTAVVVEAVEQVVGDEPFIVQNGDLLCHPDILRALQPANEYSTIMGIHHADPRQYAVLETDANGMLQKIAEKPENPTITLANLGLYAFTPAIFSAIHAVGISPRGEFEVTEAINTLAHTNGVRVLETEKPWAHLTAPEDKKNIENFLIDLGYV